MIIKNNLPKQITVVLNGQKYVWNNGDEIEVTEAEGKWILRIEPQLAIVEPKTVEIHSEPVKIQEPKAKKDVVKSKKSRK